eukprot:comp23342_c0_seq1/m.58637 comp23342_c0_seq1/g.58637  ORF comp23342_c0_seq1/g.58637 comp23342_c0_seq1/m.58637 type:complete len:901 (-) comp23342_c0_seq1:975-3677(-)
MRVCKRLQGGELVAVELLDNAENTALVHKIKRIQRLDHLHGRAHSLAASRVVLQRRKEIGHCAIHTALGPEKVRLGLAQRHLELCELRERLAKERHSRKGLWVRGRVGHAGEQPAAQHGDHRAEEEGAAVEIDKLVQRHIELRFFAAGLKQLLGLLVLGVLGGKEQIVAQLAAVVERQTAQQIVESNFVFLAKRALGKPLDDLRAAVRMHQTVDVHDGARRDAAADFKMDSCNVKEERSLDCAKPECEHKEEHCKQAVFLRRHIRVVCAVVGAVGTHADAQQQQDRCAPAQNGLEPVVSLQKVRPGDELHRETREHDEQERRDLELGIAGEEEHRDEHRILLDHHDRLPVGHRCLVVNVHRSIARDKVGVAQPLLGALDVHKVDHRDQEEIDDNSDRGDSNKAIPPLFKAEQGRERVQADLVVGAQGAVKELERLCDGENVHELQEQNVGIDHAVAHVKLGAGRVHNDRIFVVLAVAAQINTHARAAVCNRDECRIDEVVDEEKQAEKQRQGPNDHPLELVGGAIGALRGQGIEIKCERQRQHIQGHAERVWKLEIELLEHAENLEEECNNTDNAARCRGMLADLFDQSHRKRKPKENKERHAPGPIGGAGLASALEGVKSRHTFSTETSLVALSARAGKPTGTGICGVTAEEKNRRALAIGPVSGLRHGGIGRSWTGSAAWAFGAYFARLAVGMVVLLLTGAFHDVVARHGSNHGVVGARDAFGAAGEVGIGRVLADSARLGGQAACKVARSAGLAWDFKRLRKVSWATELVGEADVLRVFLDQIVAEQELHGRIGMDSRRAHGHVGRGVVGRHVFGFEIVTKLALEPELWQEVVAVDGDVVDHARGVARGRGDCTHCGHWVVDVWGACGRIRVHESVTSDTELNRKGSVGARCVDHLS